MQCYNIVIIGKEREIQYIYLHLFLQVRRDILLKYYRTSFFFFPPWSRNCAATFDQSMITIKYLPWREHACQMPDAQILETVNTSQSPDAGIFETVDTSRAPDARVLKPC